MRVLVAGHVALIQLFLLCGCCLFGRVHHATIIVLRLVYHLRHNPVNLHRLAHRPHKYARWWALPLPKQRARTMHLHLTDIGLPILVRKIHVDVYFFFL